jgi:antibiotic biosynthesis monooxygenase (ABM) superfamily enzyme
MVEGEPTYRQLDGLEAWFRDSHGAMPPCWKMALLTWLAVWPVSMLVPALLLPILGPNFPQMLAAGIIAAGIVVILTWVAMPLLVSIARRWLYPLHHSSNNL